MASMELTMVTKLASNPHASVSMLVLKACVSTFGLLLFTYRIEEQLPIIPTLGRYRQEFKPALAVQHIQGLPRLHEILSQKGKGTMPGTLVHISNPTIQELRQEDQ